MSGESPDTLLGSEYTYTNDSNCSHICARDSLLHYILYAGGGDICITIPRDPGSSLPPCHA